MFKYDKYPELEKLHKKYKKLVDEIYTIELKLEKKSNNKLLQKQYEQSYAECKQFETVYEKAIFDIFVKIGPNMFNRRTKSFETWEHSFSMNYDTVPEANIGCLICAVEEEGGIYRFPPEYYF